MEGNQMKMREALLKLRAEIGRFYYNEWIPYDAWQGCDDVISHALSAPPRNCDVGTPDEQASRMRQFCTKQKRNGIINCGYCPIKHEYQRDCTLSWAQLPYEAEGESDEQK